jgi:hypothetical protein
VPITLQDLKSELNSLEHIEETISDLTRRLDGLKREKNQLETQVLPGLYQLLGCRSMTTDSGRTAKLGLVATGKLPSDPEERQEAIDWLVAEGYEGNIEAKVTASWSRGDRAKALALVQQLRQDNSVKLTLDEGVHWKTLGKLMKDRIIGGQEVPADMVGVEVLPRVRFTQPQARGENHDEG